MRSSFFHAFAVLPLIFGFLEIPAARAQEYPSEIGKADPVAMAAWRSVVPAEYRKQSWIAAFRGTETPLEKVTIRQKLFYYGAVCIPHDCGGNFVAFLIAADGSEASGLLASQTLAVAHRYFGAPDAEARGLLEKKVSE